MFVNIYQGDTSKPETIRSIIVWAAVLLFIGYQIVNAFVANGEMIIYVRILDISATTAALYIFARDAWKGLWRRAPRPRDFLITGIWLKFFSAWLIGIYGVVYRLAGEPKWLFNNEILPLALMIGIVAVVLHICTPGTAGAVPRRSQYALAVSLGAATLIAGFLVASKPDIRPWVEPLKPWISDWWRTGEVKAPVEKPKASS